MGALSVCADVVGPVKVLEVFCDAALVILSAVSFPTRFQLLLLFFGTLSLQQS